jgi:hypothetical protein
MRYLLIFYLLSVSWFTQAQEVKPCPCENDLNETFEARLKGKVYMRLSGLTGTEFYTPTYLKGDIFLENGEVAVDQFIRYNGRIDGLVLVPPYSREIQLDKYFIKSFSLKNYKDGVNLYFSKITVAKEFSKDSVQIFGQILYQNRLSLYAFRRYIYQYDVLEHKGNKQIANPFYGPSFIYYFILPGGKTIGFKKFKKRDIYAIFPDRKDEIKRLFRENHQRKFKTEDNLIKITELLNTIIK